MQIHLKEITIRELVENYQNSEEEGVYGYNGKLNIRPKYQREFCYKPEQQQAVIETISKNFPLNVMYWVLNQDGTYELLDGQQRTLSICEFYVGNFMVNCYDNTIKAFHNLSGDQQNNFLSYKLMVYVCENGSDQEKLDWFKVINIAGEVLTNQEIRNAVYSGSWVTAAKKKFSKSTCVAYKLGKDYLSGTPIRQDYLETVISWINNGKIEEYMATHQHDNDAEDLWKYFSNVIEWVKKTFPKLRKKEMNGVSWGILYNTYKDETFEAEKLEIEIKKLMSDSDVTNKKGIYYYVFDHKEKHLSIRAFDENTKRSVYEQQNGKCKKCGKEFDISEMEADHITPWCEGGRTIDSNCQMLCKECNRKKSDK